MNRRATISINGTKDAALFNDYVVPLNPYELGGLEGNTPNKTLDEILPPQLRKNYSISDSRDEFQRLIRPSQGMCNNILLPELSNHGSPQAELGV